MDARILDVIIGAIAFILLIVLLAVLPIALSLVLAMPLGQVASFGYLAAIIIFIFFLSGAGYLVNEKIT